MDRGQRFFTEGNYDKARVEFRNALQITPNDAEARFMNGRVAEKLGDLRTAAGMYQGAIDLNADHIGARANLARMIVFGGNAQRALELVEPGLAKHPDDAALLTVRAAARSQIKDRDGAMQDAEHALKIAPDSADTVALMASLYQQSGQGDRAIELTKNFVAKHAEDVDLRQVLASLYLSAQNNDAAFEQLSKIIELRPKELPPRAAGAPVRRVSARMTEAEKVMRGRPTRCLTTTRRSSLTSSSSPRAAKSARGEEALRSFISKDPDNYDLQLGLGALQQRNGSVDAALATYRKVMANSSSDAQAAAITASNRVAGIEADRGQRRRSEEASRSDAEDQSARQRCVAAAWTSRPAE